MLAEKGPLTLQTGIPGFGTATVASHNPLEKLPILIAADGGSVYESHLILE